MNKYGLKEEDIEWHPEGYYTDEITVELNDIVELLHQVYETWYDNFENSFQAYDFSNGKPDSMDRLHNALNELLEIVIEFKKDTDPANRANK